LCPASVRRLNQSVGTWGYWAAEEVTALPNGRSEAVKLLGNLQTELNLKKTKSKEEEEAMVKLHPAFVEQLEQAESPVR
jgi:hypothetical protein